MGQESHADMELSRFKMVEKKRENMSTEGWKENRDNRMNTADQDIFAGKIFRLKIFCIV